MWQEMKLIIPNSERVNRGNMELNTLVESCKSHGVSDLIILTETRGDPGKSHMSQQSQPSLPVDREF